MAGSKILIEKESSHIRDDPLSFSMERKPKKEIFLRITAEVIEPDRNMDDEYIAAIENPNPYNTEEIGNIPFATFESSLPTLDRRRRKHVDEIDSELELEDVHPIIDPDVQDELITILKIYKGAVNCLSELQSRSKKYGFSQTLQLEDMFDYITTALTEYAGDKKKQIEILDIVQDNLKNAFFEDIRDFVIELFSLVLEFSRKPRLYYRLAFFSLPDKSKIEADLKRTKHHLLRAHELKDRNWEFCMREFEKAYNTALNLKNQFPGKNEARYRFFVILISLISGTAAVISFFP